MLTAYLVVVVLVALVVGVAAAAAVRCTLWPKSSSVFSFAAVALMTVRGDSLQLPGGLATVICLLLYDATTVHDVLRGR